MLFRFSVKSRALLVGLIAITILNSTNLLPTHASEKVGAKCTAFGKTVVKGGTKLTCVKITEYKWVAAPIKPALSTIYNPVLPGKKFTINTLQFQTDKVDFDFGDVVCRENGFNEGCIYSGALVSSVDPESPNRWISVDLIISNLSKKIISAVDMNFSFYMILPNGKYIESDRSASYESAPVDIVLNPSIPTTMRVGFELPKVVENLNPIIVIRDDSNAKSKDYFFYLNW